MQLFFDFPVNPEYSFENFVTCSGNLTALGFAKRLLDSGSGENLLYLHGDDGSGKTHLLAAIGRELGAQVIAVSDLGKESGGLQSEVVRGFPALLLDDLQLLADDADLRIALWQLFNDFYSTGRKVVATATLPPKELESLDPHLKSRFMWGLVAKLDISDDDSRRMILQKLADDRQIILPEDVSSYLLVHLPRAIPPLAEAIDRIKRHSFATQRKISLKLAREVLG